MLNILRIKKKLKNTLNKSYLFKNFKRGFVSAYDMYGITNNLKRMRKDVMKRDIIGEAWEDVGKSLYEAMEIILKKEV